MSTVDDRAWISSDPLPFSLEQDDHEMPVTVKEVQNTVEEVPTSSSRRFVCGPVVNSLHSLTHYQVVGALRVALHVVDPQLLAQVDRPDEATRRADGVA